MSQGLASLRGLRTAPSLDPAACSALRLELEPLLARCDWFTAGVMAASAASALTCLRQVETALAWSHLELDPAGVSLDSIEGPVFLKANQNSGRFQVRAETGLGEGLLISGHCSADTAAEDTWGPLPLDFFGP